MIYKLTATVKVSTWHKKAQSALASSNSMLRKMANRKS